MDCKSPQTVKLPTGYSRHLTDPVRIQIGKALIDRELNKILKSSPLSKIQFDTGNLFRNLESEIELRDFWNLVYALTMGYKIKYIVREVTSVTVDWQFEAIESPDNLIFTTDYPDVACNGRSYLEIRNRILGDSELYERQKQVIDQIYGDRFETLLEPIIIRKTNRKMFVLDGNGRLFSHIYKIASISHAYVGKDTGGEKSNHWVPTSLITELIYSTRNTQQMDLLVEILNESDNALYTFLRRVGETHPLRALVLGSIGGLIRTRPAV